MVPLTHNRSAHGGDRAGTSVQRGLDPFVGIWSTEGRQYAGAFGPAARVLARESFRWLTGGRFLVHRLEGLLGAVRMACIDVIERQPFSSGYRMDTFYHDGRSQIWHLEERAGTWIIRADWPLPGGAKRKVRCMQQFDNGGDRRTATWESSSNGTKWETFWNVISTKR
jgi:hypothetical protein